MRWLLLIVFVFGCTGSDRRRPGIRRDAGGDAALADAARVDAAGEDASADSGSTDAATDAGSDASSVDTGVDAGPVACDPGAPGVCGGRPCVDGYCCDDPCDGECRSCGRPGQEGTCSVTPGEICDDGSPATTGDMCQADGSCVGTMTGCALPADACATGSQSRDGCGGARIIGRSNASAGYLGMGDTCSARDRFDDCSWDAGNDHAYRIWMRTGETINVSVSRRDTCFSGYSITLKLYENTGCSDVTCGRDIWCNDFVDNGERFPYTATTDGWKVIVVDGSTAFDDEGQYSLAVQLTGCATPGCEC
ncbi:MAG: hypothetical protein AAGE52_09545 [Myxococcota bacterium]